MYFIINFTYSYRTITAGEPIFIIDSFPGQPISIPKAAYK